ncbi:PGCA protein, partial [Polypterus senegalus]
MNQKLSNISKNYLHGIFWIGLYHDRDIWQWPNGEKTSYYNWKRNLFCAYAKMDGSWMDSYCDVLKPFICYKGTCGPLSCNTTYHNISNWMSWYDAQSYCRSHYTDLVTIENQTVNDQLLQILGQRQGWIGLRHGNDTWQWSDGDQLTYKNWNPTRYCARVQPDGSWADSICSDQIPFMCYKAHVLAPLYTVGILFLWKVRGRGHDHNSASPRTREGSPPGGYRGQRQGSPGQLWSLGLQHFATPENAARKGSGFPMQHFQHNQVPYKRGPLTPFEDSRVGRRTKLAWGKVEEKRKERKERGD